MLGRLEAQSGDDGRRFQCEPVAAAETIALDFRGVRRYLENVAVQADVFSRALAVSPGGGSDVSSHRVAWPPCFGVMMPAGIDPPAAVRQAAIVAGG